MKLMDIIYTKWVINIMRKKISIIVPFYNEKENLPKILNEVQKLIKIEINYDFELILMDNNSNDGSEQIAKNELKNFIEGKYIKLSRNFGYQANIKAGYDNCTGDAAVQLDAVVEASIAKAPTTVFKVPVVFDSKEAYPTAVLLLAVLFVKELDPTATFWLVFATVSKAEVPIATLCVPVAFPKPAL